MLDSYLHNFSAEDISELKRLFPYVEKIKFKKNEYLTQMGQVERYYYFIEKGNVRFWTIRNNKEVTLDFVSNGEFCTSFESVTLQQPSLINVQAISQVQALRIAKNNFDKVLSESRYLEQIKLSVLERFLMHKFQREFELLCDSPEERYHNLINKSPDVLNLVSLKHIATYLGITPETLSRIRNRIKNTAT